MKSIGKIRNTESLTDKAYSHIKTALNRGAFNPGQRLTSREVAAALGVSITPAREALGKLVAEGTLELQGPRTITVPKLSRKRFDEILETRLSLEPKAAKIAAKKSTPALIRKLESIQERFEAARATKDFGFALELNSQFHKTLYEQAGNGVMTSMIESLWMMIGPSLNLLYPIYSTDDTGITPHRQLLAALKAGDVDAVRQAIVEDLTIGASKMRTLLVE